MLLRILIVILPTPTVILIRSTHWNKVLLKQRNVICIHATTPFFLCQFDANRRQTMMMTTTTAAGKQIAQENASLSTMKNDKLQH